MTKTAVATLALIALLVPPAVASDWGGHHGTIHLSFTPAPEITATTEIAPKGSMGVLVDVHAVLADVEPLLYEGARILDVGGFELKLEVVGAEGYRIIKQTVPARSLNVSEDPAQCWVGLLESISIKDGPAVLVTWQVLIEGDAQNVEFRLASDALFSAEKLEGCAESGSYALWGGAIQAGQHDLLMSAAYTPAYLNWEGEVDLEPRAGATHWSETGLFELQE